MEQVHCVLSYRTTGSSFCSDRHYHIPVYEPARWYTAPRCCDKIAVFIVLKTFCHCQMDASRVVACRRQYIPISSIVLFLRTLLYRCPVSIICAGYLPAFAGKCVQRLHHSHRHSFSLVSADKYSLGVYLSRGTCSLPQRTQRPA